MLEQPVEDPFDPAGISRPDRKLLKYYAIVSAFTGPLFPLMFLPLFFKYETLKYRFDESGVSMSWGILFRREIHLTYRRIQDIHLTRNLIQRWMGLATVSIQTASGGSGPEMSMEGILAAGKLRDYLYAQMRGARGDAIAPEGSAEDFRVTAIAQGQTDDALSLLREIRDSLQVLTDRDGTAS